MTIVNAIRVGLASTTLQLIVPKEIHAQELVLPSIPAQTDSKVNVNKIIERVKDPILDELILKAFALGLGLAVGGYALVRNHKRRFDGEIEVEMLDMNRTPGTDSKMMINFYCTEAKQLEEIFSNDPIAMRMFKRGIREFRKKNLSFVVFRNDLRVFGRLVEYHAHHLIGLPIVDWCREVVGVGPESLDAPAKRLQFGLKVEDCRVLRTGLMFFTCERLASAEQPRAVLVQPEDLVNVLSNLPAWWETTKRENKFEEIDNKHRLSRILEFAVSIAIRYPNALRNVIQNESDKVERAINRAQDLSKLLFLNPKESVAWIETFLKKTSGDPAAKLPDDLKISPNEWKEVLLDWYGKTKKDFELCKILLSHERKAASFELAPGLSVDHEIPLFFLTVPIPEDRSSEDH